MSDDILFTVQGALGIIILNRPQALNALTLSMIKSLQNQLIEWENNPTIHAIVIQAVPGKAFCAGGDVRWLYEAGLAKNPAQLEFFKEEYRLNFLIHELKKPYIALMDGFTMGGGVGISLHGSHRVASEKFIFSMPETAIGLFPDVGASYLLSHCPGKIGLFLGLTGQRLDGAEAYEAGLVDYVISTEHYPTIIEQLIKLDLSQKSHEKVTNCLNQFATKITDKITQFSQELEYINTYFSPPTICQLIENLKQGNTEWSLGWYDKLHQKSPMSLAVTFMQINNAVHLSLEECLNVDYCLVKHFMANPDFYEGVRSLLIDKDNCPNWQPHTLDNVTPKRVTEYFE